MSTCEYYDLFLNSQTTGQYHMFIFDIEGSKKMDTRTRNVAAIKMEKLMLKIYNDIKEKEIKTGQKILVINIDDIVHYEIRYKNARKFGMLFEPFLFADTFGFTIYRNTLTKEEILFIYQKYKQELNINFNFHINDGFYETNKYSEGNYLFFRGYCIDILSKYHKDYNKTLRKKNKNV